MTKVEIKSGGQFFQPLESWLILHPTFFQWLEIYVPVAARDFQWLENC